MNTLVLAVDGFHSGFTGYGGCTWIETPEMDALAAQGVVFDRFFTDRLKLSAIYDTIWSGKEQTFAQRVAQQGFKTALFSDSEDVLEHPGTAGFQIIESSLDEDTSPELADELEQTRLFETFASLADLIQELSKSDKPFFCWAHIGSMGRLWDAPYSYRSQYSDEGDLPPLESALIPEALPVSQEFNPDAGDSPIVTIPILQSALPSNSDEQTSVPDDVKLQLAQTYAGQVNVLDDCLSLLTTDLKETGLWDKTTLALFSTRGIGLGEHGEVGLNYPTFHTEFARLTGLIRAPQPLFGLRRTQALIAPADWSALLESLTTNPESFALPAGRCRLLSEEDDRRVVQTAAWRYLYDVSAPHDGQLYVMPDDRWEVNDTSSICENVIEEILSVTEQSELSELLTNVFH
ncbi:MAG: sulfatase-like hydrolase/transferase [Thermoguttaceae bacterium]|nr:sulfatase-like hydrolase/transferase [Thermoguttaceae bacterium]